MLAAVDDGARRDRRGRNARACSPSTRSTCSTRSADASCRSATRGAVQVSGATGEGLDDAARGASRRASWRRLRPMELLRARTARAARLSELHDLAGELEREDTPEGVRVRGARARRASRRASSALSSERRGARSDAALPAPVARRRGRPRAPTSGDAGYDLRAARGGATRARRAGERRHRHRGRDPGGPGRAWCCRAPGSPPGTASRSSNAPGLIDSGYRGEVRVLLLNTDRARAVRGRARRPHRAARRGERREELEFDEVGELDETARGAARLRLQRRQLSAARRPRRDARERARRPRALVRGAAPSSTPSASSIRRSASQTFFGSSGPCR